MQFPYSIRPAFPSQSRATLWFAGLMLSLAVTAPDCTFAQTLRHRILTADSSRNRIALIDEAGRTEWEMKIGPLHDLHLLENGNVLLQTSWTFIAEIDQATGQAVWQYDALVDNTTENGKVEIHAFQRLDNGNTMVAESGRRRIVEVDPGGEIVHEVMLKVEKPHPHHDTRLARQLANGNYLVCHENDGVVREYGRDGRIHWEYEIPLFGREPVGGHGAEAFGNQCFAALRLENGNTLISTGNGHSLIEVTSRKEIVWRLESDDLPGITLAWLTTIQRLPNGNVVFGNCHAGPDNPQVIEITRDKQVVWTFHDFERFGNALTNTQVSSTNGKRVSAIAGRDR